MPRRVLETAGEGAADKFPDERRAVLETHLCAHLGGMLRGEVFKAGVAKRVRHIRDALEIENDLFVVGQGGLHFAKAEAVANVAVGEKGAEQIEHFERLAHRMAGDYTKPAATAAA